MRRTRSHQRGYVFRKGNAWYVRYRECVRGQSGRVEPVQRCHRLGVAVGEYRSKASAKRLAEEFLKPFNDGTYQPENASTLGRFIEGKYLPFIERQKRPSTYHGYRKMWKRYLEPRSAVALRDFKTMDCEGLLSDIAREHDVSRTTLAHVKNMLSGVFRYAARIGVLNTPNPVRDVCLPQARNSGETYAYSLDEITRMLAVLPEPSNVVVAVAAFTGLRLGEIRGLRPEDHDGNVLRVRRSVWKRHIGEPKGKRGKGAVPVIAPLAKLLDSYVVRFAPKNYLFQTHKGGPADLDYLSRRVIAPLLSTQGLQWHGWHAFRRGLATNLHELGVQDIVIQAILRHSDVGVTRESYIKRHGVDVQSMAAMKALEQLVCNHCATGAARDSAATVVN